MKFTTLFENTACSDSLASGHGLSLYIETAHHHILFDMGPDDGFARNAASLGVDLERVDTAVLSHGHYDHGGGLETFTRMNPRAKIYIHRAAFGDYYAERADGLEYIGIDQSLDLYRFTMTPDEYTIDDELRLFGAVPDPIGALAASSTLRQRTWDGTRQDVFAHAPGIMPMKSRRRSWETSSTASAAERASRYKGTAPCKHENPSVSRVTIILKTACTLLLSVPRTRPIF